MAGPYKKRAERGAYVLDVLQPDWKTSIDQDTLDLGSETSCVFGQVFGDFNTGYQMICKLYEAMYPSATDTSKPGEGMEPWKWLTEHGFGLFKEPVEADGNTYTWPRSPTLRKRYTKLTNAWKDVLNDDALCTPAESC